MGLLVEGAQRLLRQVDPSLAIDGFWGPKTQKAFEAASDSTRLAIRQMWGANGKIAPNGDRWISAMDADEYVDRAVAALNMREYADAFKGFLRLEARQRTVGGVTQFDVNSRNGSSTGLMQMQPGAWVDAQKVDSSLPGFGAGVYKPEVNIRAGVAYASRNISAIRRANRPVNEETLYLAHNQGAGFFNATGSIVTNFDGQSVVVQDMIRRNASRPVFRGAHSKF